MNIMKKDNTMKTRKMTPTLQKEEKKKMGRKAAVSSTLLVVDKEAQRAQ